MAFPAVVTSGRTGWNNGNITVGNAETIDVPYAAGAVDDLIVVVLRVNRPVIDGSLVYITSTPTGWARLDVAYQNGAVDEWQTMIVAQKAAGTASGTCPFDVSGNTSGNTRPAAVSYRIAGWHGTLADGVEALFLDSDSLDPPSLTPAWGAADTLWIAGVNSQGSNATITANPTNYVSRVDSIEDDATLSGNNHYTRCFASERNLNASTEDPGLYTFSSESLQTERPFTIAVRPTSSGLSFTTTPSVTSRTPTSYTIEGTLSAEGEMYAVAVPQGAATPSIAQIVAGQNAAGTAAAGAGSGASNVSSPHDVSVTVSGVGLGSDASHDIHYVGRNEA